ncbi:xanthine dehydrogenase-like [Contarinia nasturtii]|uniref:xanthine dehydrogenase-like n=1 Tax=Contarinia nasturtii TaxID=265458 RepID=UPI0012D43069|nr:xanthine dehydrogenase-like [Contarinia nasturtii]
MEVKFMLNQQEYTIRPNEVPIDTSLLVYIRSHARLTGTKFMCLEGGCGVCNVNISGIVTPAGDRRTFAINSCLWPVYACNGLNVTTIEGIGNLKSDYHPIQKALYHFNGTQCGYCSPGMVMNMYGLLQANDGKVTMQQVENSFGGNICRCTGYRPILDAFKSLARDSCGGDGGDGVDIEDLTLDLCHMNENRKCSIEGNCNKKCGINRNVSLEICGDDGRMWLRPANLSELMRIFSTKTMHTEYMLVAGNTAHGVYRRSENIQIFIDIKAIEELQTIKADESSLIFGGNVSLTELMETLRGAATRCNKYTYGTELAKHIDLVAHVPVRNAGTIAGNLCIKHAHNEFSSDIFLLLETIGAHLKIASIDGLVRTYSPKEFLSLDMLQKVILSVVFPKLAPDQFVFRSYKVMPRAQNAHAMVNAAFLFEFGMNDGKASVKSCQICYGGINPQFIHAEATEKLLTGVDDFYTEDVLQKAIKSLQNEIEPDSVLPDPPADYRQKLAIALFYRFFLNTAPADKIKSEYSLGRTGLDRPLSSGIQTYESDEKSYPLTQPLTKYEGLIQCTGEAQYVNDMFSASTVDNELWCAFVPATEVHSKIVQIDATKALNIPGVVAFFSAKDIPGENSFMPLNAAIDYFSEAEPIFLTIDSEVQFNGQPCGVIVAKTMAVAHSAATKVDITYEKSQINRPIIPSVRHWRQKNESNACKDRKTFRIPPNQNLAMPLIGQELKIKGDFEIGSQYHMTMEPQTVFCTPNDDGGINLHVSTQFLDLSHCAVANCLKMPQSKIIASFKRCGGGYGAKVTRVSQVACACAVACHLLRMPVRFVMNIESNMTIMGKRYGCAVEYDLKIDSATGRLTELKPLAVTLDFGYSMNDDTSGFMLHCMMSLGYAHAREWLMNINRLKTDAPSATWARSPGTTETVVIFENMMEHIAHEINIDPAQVRINNFHADSPLHKIFPEFLKDINYFDRRAKINEFNKQNRWRKRGIGVSVMTFPTLYVASFSAYIAIYHGDGTVAISHGGIEIGQGINTKVAQVVAHIFKIPMNMITVTEHSSIVMANRTLTGGSITSEAVCMAAKRACDHILERMKPIREKNPNGTWLEIVQASWRASIELTEKQTFENREAKSYNINGCASVELELDVLTGNLQILRADIHEDTGKSMNPLVDVGQIEGAFMMGIGYWLNEQLSYDQQTGQLITNRTWNYKVPGPKDIPIDFRVKFLQNVNNEGVFSSKTTGEPPLTLSVVSIFALRHALNSIHEDNGQARKWIRLGTGNTPDVVFSAAELNVDNFKLN